MTEAHDIAREAAQRLASKYGASLPIEVEKAILGGEARTQFVSPGDLANIAMAVAAYAALAWAIWHDTRPTGTGPAPAREPEAIRRELRIKLPAPRGIDATTRDDIIITIVEEVLKK